MKRGRSRLMFVAHPDDESLFFASVLLRYRSSVHVVCVTDGNADGDKLARQAQFHLAMETLGVDSFEFWDEQDHYDVRLPVERLIARIRAMRADGWQRRPKLRAVFTHGPLGEYGHPHHQDVSRAVHEVFHGKSPVYSPAYNLEPDFSYTLSKTEFSSKCKVLVDVYLSETRKFVNLIPATAVEGFVEMDLDEVRALHDFFAAGVPLHAERLPRSRWLLQVLPHLRARLKARLF